MWKLQNYESVALWKIYDNYFLPVFPILVSANTSLPGSLFHSYCLSLEMRNLKLRKKNPQTHLRFIWFGHRCPEVQFLWQAVQLFDITTWYHYLQCVHLRISQLNYQKFDKLSYNVLNMILILCWSTFINIFSHMSGRMTLIQISSEIMCF